MTSCPSTFVDVSDEPARSVGGGGFRLLIVDRQPEPLLRLARQAFAGAACHIETACTAAAAITRIANDPPDVILLDPKLSDRCGLDLQQELSGLDANLPIIFVSLPHSADTAIRAMKQGAYDFLYKPVDERQLHRAVTEALKVASINENRTVPAALTLTAESAAIQAGGCVAMREVYKSIGLVAGQDVNVLITGESGTGKELVARAIHQHSSRANAPFLALNCAAIPENLLESELFGHERGAFSGADRRRVGKFEQYSGGTILLDEIGDMPLNLQAKILRLLQEQTFERVGGNETIHTNVRIIASTHRDLKTWSAQEKFRADLYYRLSVFTIHLPPLRERGDDIAVLARYFVAQYSRELGRGITAIAPDCLQRLQDYAWPGNIRELQSVIKQALLRAVGPVLLSSFLPKLGTAAAEPQQEGPPSVEHFDLNSFLHQRLKPDVCDLYADLHRELDRYSLARVLTYTRGNQHMASRVLGIARQTLRARLRETGLSIKQSVDASPAMAWQQMDMKATDYTPAGTL